MIDSNGVVGDYSWDFTYVEQVVTVPAGTLFCQITFGSRGAIIQTVYHNSQAVSGVVVSAQTFYTRAFGLFKVFVSSQALPVSDDDDFEPVFDTENMDLTYGNKYPDLPQVLMNMRAVEVEAGFTNSYSSTVLLPYSQFSWFSMDDTHQYYQTDGHIYPSKRWFDFMFSQGPWVFDPYE